MKFTCRTVYDKNSSAVMARGLRKTVRKKHSRRSHIFGWIVTVLSVMLLISSGPSFDAKKAVTCAAIIFMVSALIWEDKINGYFAYKRMLPGMRDNLSVFIEEGYYTENAVGKTEWSYSGIDHLAENSRYFVFVFGKNHAQVYDKQTIEGGSALELRQFLEEKTGLKVTEI